MTNKSFENAIEYDIYVPLRDAAGQLYADDRTSPIKKELATFFGGITDTQHNNKGLWKVGGMLLRDELVVWRLLSQKQAAGDEFIKSIKIRLEKTLKQDLILIVRREVQCFS